MEKGTKVIHNTLGEGAIEKVEHNENGNIYIWVAFPGKPKAIMFGYKTLLQLFTLPEEVRMEAEAGFKEEQERERLRAEAEALQKQQRERERLQQLQAEREAKAAKAGRTRSRNAGERKKKASTAPRNIAFKCVYCDGGQSEGRVGYDGVCSERTRKYNLRHHKTGWCNQPGCLCRKYLDGSISRAELDGAFANDNACVCFEANIFRGWEYSAGASQPGKARAIRRDVDHKLCVLTTAFPKAKKKERYIFAAFIVGDYEPGDSNQSGRVFAHPTLRIELNADEMKQMCFWDYHQNKSTKNPYLWGEGLFRYFDDAAAKRILEDIRALKTDPADKALIDEMLKYVF